ncbi:MAG: polysaccharide deacetylase family protein [Thermoguttaceae bacterium]|nr:polysaccharide deacetylase family protein [Thermoguttaceae bacterium]
MKRILSFLFAFFAAAMVCGGEKTTTLLVEYAAASDAQGAQMETLELPPGKTLAVASRWDDTNGDHYFMTEALAENGWKGTFYLNRVDDHYRDKVVKFMVENGCSVGSHTNNHPWLGSLVPNAVWQEIAENRVSLEAALDLPVSTFTFPFSLPGTLNDPDFEQKIGQMLVRAGINGLAEPPKVQERAKLDPKECVTCWLFRADDANPQLEVFNRTFDQGVQELEAGNLGAMGPFFVLGVHSWQKKSGPDGFQRLSKILATKAHDPAIWYCNVDEYCAWRHNFLNAQISRKSTGKKTVEFTIKRATPASVGACVPCGLKITPAPKSVSVKGRPLDVNPDGSFLLPAKNDLPVKIGLMTAENGFTSEKFPGLTIQTGVDLEKNVLHCEVSAENGKPENLVCTVRLPLRWKNGVQVKPVRLDANGKTTFDLPLGELDEDPVNACDALYVVNQCDFRLNGEPMRVYSTVTLDQPEIQQAVPRTTAMTVGVCNEKFFDAEKLAASSRPSAELQDLGDEEFTNWVPCDRSGKILPYVMECHIEWSGGMAVYAVQFEADAQNAADCMFKVTDPYNMKNVFLNGEPVEVHHHGITLKAQPGVNRLIYVLKGAGYGIRKSEISIKKEDGEMVKFVPFAE